MGRWIEDMKEPDPNEEFFGHWEKPDRKKILGPATLDSEAIAQGVARSKADVGPPRAKPGVQYAEEPPIQPDVREKIRAHRAGKDGPKTYSPFTNPLPSLEDINDGIKYVGSKFAGGMPGLAFKDKPASGPAPELMPSGASIADIGNARAPATKPKGSASGGGAGSSRSSKRTTTSTGPVGGQMDLAMQVQDVAEQGEAGALPEAEQTAYDNLKEKIARHKTGVDLSPLMALSDTWFGGNLRGGYERPMTDDERDLKLAGVEMDEAKRGTELGIKNADRIQKMRQAVLKYMSEKDKAQGLKDFREAKLKIDRARVGAIQGRAGGRIGKPTVTANPYVGLKTKQNGRNFEKVVFKHTPEGQAADVGRATAYIDRMALALQEQGVDERTAADRAYDRFSERGYGKSAGKDEHTTNEGMVDKALRYLSGGGDPMLDDEDEEDED